MKRAACPGVPEAAMPAPPEKLNPAQEHKLRRELRELREQLRSQVSAVVLNQEYQQFVAEVAALMGEGRVRLIPRTIKAAAYGNGRRYQP